MLIRTNRKQQRAKLQSTWGAYQAREAGTPLTRRDMEAAREPEELTPDVPDLTALDAHMRGIIGRFSQ